MLPPPPDSRRPPLDVTGRPALPQFGAGVYVPIGGGVRGRGGRCEAGLRNGRTDLRRGEEGGAVPDHRGGGRPRQGEAAATPTGGVPLPATGVPQPAAWKCQKKQDNTADE